MQGSERTEYELLQALLPLARASSPSEDLLHELCKRLSSNLRALAVVICALDEDTKPWLVAGPSSELQKLGEEQFSLGEGPCIDACRHGEPVWARLDEAGDRWPRWAPQAVDAGIDAVVSLPVADEHGRLPPLGTVWMAFDHAGWLEDVALWGASTAAAVAIRQFALQREIEQRRVEVGQLQHALDSRIVIEQAKGFLAAREGIEVDVAFDRMRRRARSTQRKLHDVARQVLREGQLPTG